MKNKIEKFLREFTNFLIVIAAFIVASTVLIHLGKMVWKFWAWNFNLW